MKPPASAPLAAPGQPPTELEAQPSPRGPAEDVARTAGRGGIAVAFGKVYFILVGLVQQIALPRVLGLSGYGALSSVLSIASIVYNPIVSTSIQGVSRAVAHAPDDRQAQATRAALKIHALLTLPAAVAFFLAAPSIGAWARAPHIVTALRITSGVLLFYGLYTPLVGVLNGQKRFLSQAGLDISFATLRTIGLIGAGYWFATSFDRGVEGAVVGFVAASALILGVALWQVGTGRAGAGGPTVRQHLAFVGPLLLGQTLLNLLLQADLTLLRRFAGEAAVTAGRTVEAADPLVGAYRATQLFCFLPYQLLIAITFILFPMLATAYRDGDREAVARYVRTGVRLAVVLMGLMVSVTSGLSGPLLRLVFPEEAAVLGTRAMQLLTLGFGAFAVFGILTTVLNSLKQERQSALVTAVAFGLVVVLCFVRVRGGPFGEELLLRTATATTAGLLLATLAAGVLVKKSAGAVLAPATALRVGLAMAVAIAVARQLPASSKPMTVVFSAVIGAIYVALLLVTRELGRADLDSVKAVVSRRRGA